MNREIEFRGFLKGYNNNKCFEISVLALKECGWACDKGIGVSIPYQPHVKIMQYTGLKDKNGKKIFEGDIVNIEYQQTTIENAIIEYHGAGFYGCTNSDMWELDDYCSVEVIGNIYENDLESKGE